MTAPAADTLERETEFVTDAELIRRMGVPERTARATIRALDQNPRSGFPKKIPHWGGRRHWPSVRRYLEQTCSSTMGTLTNHRGSHA